jgi:hypothetical protein
MTLWSLDRAQTVTDQRALTAAYKLSTEIQLEHIVKNETDFKRTISWPDQAISTDRAPDSRFNRHSDFTAAINRSLNSIQVRNLAAQFPDSSCELRFWPH